jgi:hypothetical protein
MSASVAMSEALLWSLKPVRAVKATPAVINSWVEKKAGSQPTHLPTEGVLYSRQTVLKGAFLYFPFPGFLS